ncbi:class I SAM-dependent methyltransferase [Cecembia lonarensis]|uniref:Bifunctional 3-demethylubiquinone-9 3-methyltransferase/ 2-octaprenyl-6-hydroxy phenol methylase n=1 Tax=Cecembia lonarensis (strain CCUG 58316 / KCTC 22772 / LW9) TaxID=1225176 RepID=K1L358_CECL9|nr:class I SAM-dependent methyltransferase [Cecembia lonarensis]EKB50810.1 hypothetical protein B879_00555 [Cecembia lonarensis LW9]
MSIDSVLVCKYCGHDGPPEKHQVKEMMFGTGETFNIGSCQVCGSLHLLDIPDDLSPYYPPNYYSLNTLVTSGPVKKLLKRWRYRFFLSGLSFFRPIFGQWMLCSQTATSARIADIGCGNGQLLYEMHVAGFSNLEGYDPFIPGDQVIAPGLKLFKKPLAQIEGTFDLIMMHHALEHMENPEEILRKCKGLLSKKGVLLIRIPVSDARVWEEEGVNWVQLDVPRHLHIPSIAGIKSLTERLGFKLKAMDFDSTAFQFWGTALYKEGIPLSKAGEQYFSEAALKAWQQKALLYNQQGLGDQVCFYFVKSESD